MQSLSRKSYLLLGISLIGFFTISTGALVAYKTHENEVIERVAVQGGDEIPSFDSDYTDIHDPALGEEVGQKSVGADRPTQ